MKGYLQDENGDVKTENGDLVTGDALPDIISDTIQAMPGDYSASLLLGAGLRKSINGTPDRYFEGRLKNQLISQSINIRKIVVDNSEINVQL